MQWLSDLLFPPRDDEQIVRTLTTESLCPLVNPILISSTNPPTVALLPLRNPIVRALIHEAKYHGNKRAHSILGEILFDYISSDETLREPILVPIPMMKRRVRLRAGNHTERIIENAMTTMPEHESFTYAPELLRRILETPPQVRMNRAERLRNMNGVFAASGPIDPALHYVVFDDVITTGATLQSATDALRAAGAKHISTLALAH